MHASKRHSVPSCLGYRQLTVASAQDFCDYDSPDGTFSSLQALLDALLALLVKAVISGQRSDMHALMLRHACDSPLVRSLFDGPSRSQVLYFGYNAHR